MKRPWAKRAEELLEKEGHYADFSAWEEWFREQDQYADDILNDIVGNAAFLYAIFCNVYDGLEAT